MKFPKHLTFKINIETARRLAQLNAMDIDKNLKITLSALLKCSMNDAYACGRIEKGKEILKDMASLKAQ